ncbi:MAG: short chain dehydrogenase [Altererythrobacter sp. XM-24bin4]|uniref:SDR family NAD(P)-dependent oxidoreductase n=1 Tax=uncultured Altererythrobacter sp. TaxID=500840 RepID=UPI000D7A2262|nr:SDR family NAD(P)-dependent oxidoreductase [uncultured Altererythrobacter sp.]PWL25484.1 MAG: short chain dehydrogenase [Altererythrobacter sp. XM-24bin4]
MTQSGKVAVITGAGSGMGRAVALKLASQGATVVLNGRDQNKLQVVANEIGDLGAAAKVRPGDISRRSVVAELMASVGDEFGRIDLAFNNAGGHDSFKPLHTVPDTESEWVINLNFKAVYYCMLEQLKWMNAQSSGVIVNNASIFGLKGVPGIAHYVAAKHAVIGLTRSAALDYAGSGIRINAICPGATETPNLLRVSGGDSHTFDEMIPRGRLGQPSEVADAVSWLMSNEASYITGAALSVDGGMGAS